MSEAETIHTEYLTKPSYTFLQSIHEGTAGICKVYHHELFNCPVVSKTVSLFGLPGGVAKSEPRLLKDLDHKHLVSVLEAQWDLDADPSLQVVTFTTDYCEGRSVHTALEDGYRFSINDALGIIADVLDALAYLHDDNQLVHRDVKPGNVLLDGARRRGFVGDLGSAAEMENGHVPAGAGTPYTSHPRPPEECWTIASTCTAQAWFCWRACKGVSQRPRASQGSSPVQPPSRLPSETGL